MASQYTKVIYPKSQDIYAVRFPELFSFHKHLLVQMIFIQQSKKI